MKKHSIKPSSLKWNQTWRCSCGVINIPEASECKMILIEKRKELTKIEKLTTSNEAH